MSVASKKAQPAALHAAATILNRKSDCHPFCSFRNRNFSRRADKAAELLSEKEALASFWRYKVGLWKWQH